MKTSDEIDARGKDIPNRYRCYSAPIDPDPSTYRGVYWSRRQRRWKAKLTLGGLQIWLGYFAEGDEQSAARAYDNARWWLQDLSAKRPRLNFPHELPGRMLPIVEAARKHLRKLGFQERNVRSGRVHHADFVPPEADPTFVPTPAANLPDTFSDTNG